MKKFIALFLASASALFATAQSDIPKRLATEFIMVKDGETITIPAGAYLLEGELWMDGKTNVTIKGAGKDQTFLSFKNQKSGAEGMKITNCKNITVEDLTVQDSKGDLIKVQKTIGISLHNVRAEWTGRPKATNGSYALYPVQCENVLIDGCEAIGASDAGVYVGQSDKIIVKNSRAYHCVAGIEIENSTHAEVFDNLAENNTGGILIFDLPGLFKKAGGYTVVRNNKVLNNNYKNFAPKGNIVAKIPPGTGLMVLGTSNVEFKNNEVRDNRSFSCVITSYHITEIPVTDKEYNPYPSNIYIHDNQFSKGKHEKMMPTLKNKLGKLLFLKFGKRAPNIIWDGIVKDDTVKPSDVICIKNNTNGGFANLDAANKFKKLSRDSKPVECTPAQ